MHSIEKLHLYTKKDKLHQLANDQVYHVKCIKQDEQLQKLIPV